MEGLLSGNHPTPKQRLSPQKPVSAASHFSNKQNQVGTVMLYGIPIVSLVIESQERLCLAQISNTLLKQYSYNEIHNRRVALGITCVQCTPVQLEILRRAGAMPVSSRRCGMITRREAERLCKSFLGDNAPPRLPDDFAFSVHHECAWGCRGAFLPSRYNSSRAKCIKCSFCGLFFSPNKFIFHSHRTSPGATYVQPDAANFNSWRRHMKLSGSPPDDVVHAWEDVKAMFNGGTRKRLLASSSASGTLPTRPSISTSAPVTAATTPTKQLKLDSSTSTNSPYSTPTNTPVPVHASPRVPSFPDLALPISMIDYVWQNGITSDGTKHQFPFTPYAVPWFGNSKRSVLGLSSLPSVGPQQESLLQHLCSPNSDKIYHHSAFRPVFPAFGRPDILMSTGIQNNIIRRQANSEELIAPKKKYSREMEKPETPPHKTHDVVIESVNKENEMRKTLETGDPRLESDAVQQSGLKTFFKKECVNEGSSDSEELLSRSKTHPEGIDMSKFLARKPSLLDDGVLKFRDFSPNLLEAISNLKTEERDVYTGLSVKMFSEYTLDKNNKISEPNCKKRKLEMEEHYKSEEEKEEEDDEPVDVETTDDGPTPETLDFNPQSKPMCRGPKNQGHGHLDGKALTQVEKFTSDDTEISSRIVRLEEFCNNMGNPSSTGKFYNKSGLNVNEVESRTRATVEHEKSRIWTIARFSSEEPESERTEGTDCLQNEEGLKKLETREKEKNILEEKKGKRSTVECASCYESAFGNG